MKKKERIKSIILILLVITNFGLGSRIWINKRLWPNGYNLFANIQNSFLVRAFWVMFDIENSSYTSKLHITTPDKIIINTGYQTTRFSLNNAHEQFAETNQIAYDILADVFQSTGKNISLTSEDEWFSVLTSKSIYLSYAIEYDLKLFGQFLGVKDTELANYTDYISDIVISASSTISPNAVVYFKNGKTNTYYKIHSSIPRDKLEAIIDYFQQRFEDEDIGNSVINYSFDLFFDRAFANQKAVLAPMIPIFNNPQTFHTIKSDNPILKSDNTFNFVVIERLLHIFQMNPNAVRKYTEANGTVVFVENNSILKISLDGLLEYTAKSSENGIPLTNDSPNPSNYNIIGLAADFMDQTTQTATANKDLFISSNLTDQWIHNSSMELSFDYSINGLPVILMLPDNIPSHSINMKIENGYLQSYTQLLRSYSNTDTTSQTPLYIDALDQTIQQYSDRKEQIIVNKINLGYSDDGTTGSKIADWHILVN